MGLPRPVGVFPGCWRCKGAGGPFTTFGYNEYCVAFWNDEFEMIESVHGVTPGAAFHHSQDIVFVTKSYQVYSSTVAGCPDYTCYCR